MSKYTDYKSLLVELVDVKRELNSDQPSDPLVGDLTNILSESEGTISFLGWEITPPTDTNKILHKMYGKAKETLSFERIKSRVTIANGGTKVSSVNAGEGDEDNT